jgi:micrococcal nuclease
MSRSLTIVLLLVLSAWVGLGADLPHVEHATLEARCYRVYDGDTLVLRGGERVRLLGIDAPELGEPYADDAKWALWDWVRGKTMRLELDRQERDIYGRLLAHAYVESDDDEWVLVNAELVRQGWARLLFIPPNARYRTYFDAALEEAKLQRRGLWGTIEGCLSIDEMEDRLVSLMTEMVTVRFTVGGATVLRGDLVLQAEESAFGFYVKVPEELLEAMPWASVDDLAGTCMLVTGLLGCERVGLGPSIVIEYSGQIEWPCP